MRRIIAVVLPLLLLLTACGGAQSNSGASSSANASVSAPDANAAVLSSVKVVPGAAGKAPTVTFNKPLDISAVAMKEAVAGTGAQVVAGQTVSYRTAAYTAVDGKLEGENFTSAAGGTITLSADFKAQYPLVYDTFVKSKVGSYLAYGTPASAAVPSSSTSAAVAAVPAGVSIFAITDAKDPAKLMSQDDVKALEKSGGLPTAKVSDKGVPTITIPKKDAPADLAVQVLTEGKGEVLKATDTISADYAGWTWSDSKEFDSSFKTGKAATFSLQQVIPGWTQGLTGQKVGSTVLLTIPSTLAYGDDASSGRPTGPLVFFVKIVSKN